MPEKCAILLVFSGILAGAIHAQGGSPCGDCDHSGTVLIPDALRASQMAVGLIAPLITDFETCDVDSNGSITVLDALGIAQKAVGLSPSLVCTVPPVPMVTSVAARAPLTGDILIDYMLADPEGDLCSLVVEVSTDGGFSFPLVATDAAGGDGRASLVSDPLGLPHVYAWDSLTDLGAVAVLDVVLRLTPADAGPGLPGTSASLLVDNRPPGSASWSLDLEPWISDTTPMGTGCVNCHSGPFPDADLDLSSYTGLLAGSAGGPVVIPFDAAGSKIVCKLEGQTMVCGVQMPFMGTPWTPAMVQVMRDWIDMGAQDN